ncbi:MAG: TrbC/VirB2 family protein [Halodesulfovibrio sp.]|uniref:TrbC/VirB2 family protein n=1 Tax=Halodesulfovibrio sp. TaxID=1912772 RepID=UPI00359EDAF3
MNRSTTKFLLLIALAFVVMHPDLAEASTKISEFNEPFENFVGAITGPVGRWISIAGFAISGIGLIWKRADPMDSFKTLLSVVCAISFVAFAGSLVDNGFTFSGALI